MNSDIQPVHKKLYTTTEVAKMFGVTPRSIQIWADNGVLKVMKTHGGHRRISGEEVEKLGAYLNAELTTKAEDSFPPEKQFKKHGVSVLIVEDDVDLLNLYEMNMDLWGLEFQLIKANDGYQALIEMGRSIPDVIITDLHMPKLDGFHMINMIKKNDELKNCEIIIVTGLSPDAIKEGGKLPEDVVVLTKPIPFDRIKEIISTRIAAHSN